MNTKHVSEQLWVPEMREDGVYLVAADDKTVVVRLGRPDRDSDLIIAAYIACLQARRLRKIGRAHV